MVIIYTNAIKIGAAIDYKLTYLYTLDKNYDVVYHLQGSMGQLRPKLGHSYRLASGTWGKAKAGAQLQVSIWDMHGARPKLGHSYRLASGTCMRQGQSWGTVSYSFSQVSIGDMEQGQSWGTVQFDCQFQSGRLASGIWPELARVQHSSSQILHHNTCIAKLLYCMHGY